MNKLVNWSTVRFSCFIFFFAFVANKRVHFPMLIYDHHECIDTSLVCLSSNQSRNIFIALAANRTWMNA